MLGDETAINTVMMYLQAFNIYENFIFRHWIEFIAVNIFLFSNATQGEWGWMAFDEKKANVSPWCFCQCESRDCGTELVWFAFIKSWFKKTVFEVSLPHWLFADTFASAFIQWPIKINAYFKLWFELIYDNPCEYKAHFSLKKLTLGFIEEIHRFKNSSLRLQMFFFL